MTITDDEELIKRINRVSSDLQEIQNYTADFPEESLPKRIKFPRGYIRTAQYFRTHLEFIGDSNLKKNISYLLILTDVFCWVLYKTDLFGTAKEMMVKNGIIITAAICESFAIDATRGIIGKNNVFCKRADRMLEKSIIQENLRDDLYWLWEKRSSIHIYDIEKIEYGAYDEEDYVRAVKIMMKLRDSLSDYLESKN